MKLTVRQLSVTFLIVVGIGVIGLFGANRIFKTNPKSRQAVFLTNGQVYFGYVQHPERQFVLLRGVYYLQVQQPLQQSKENESPQTQIQLIKLGNELHGPLDEMRINRDQILFIEDMKDDSKVNQAIGNFVTSGSGGATASPTPAPSPS